MANKKKAAAKKPSAPPKPPQEPGRHVAEFILGLQDKKFTQTHIQNLWKIYESTEQAVFVKQFLEVFQVAICEDAKNKRADNVLAFFLAFMMACEGEETHVLWEEFFNWILNHKNTQTHVRIRMCQFIEQFLGALNINAVLDDNICEGIERYMILNADDFSNVVRSVALNGLQRLQDPTNPAAATWKHYLFHLNDPAPNVRKSVITSICKNRFSIPKLLEHLMDKVEGVRSHLIQSLFNVSYKHYKAEDRIKLVEDGLQPGQPQAVVSGIRDTILVSWFAEMDRNYIKFAKNLLLESSWKEFQRSVQVAKKALKVLFATDAAYLQYMENQLTKTENDLMDSICDSVEKSLVIEPSQNASATGPAAVYENCIDMKRLTPEVAIYWAALLEYYQERHEDDAVFPELNLYLKYVEAFGRHHNQAADLKQKRRFQFVFGVLVDNLHLYDFKDECCRTFLKETSGRLILSSNIKKDTLRALLRIHSDVYPAELEYMDSIGGAIGDELLDDNDSSARGADQEARIKHYLKVIYMLLTNRPIKSVSPLLRSIFEQVIFPRIENGDRKIRIWSTKCTATFAALDSSMAQTFYYKLIAQLQVQHNVPVWAVIIESIFDLLARYGIEFLGGAEGAPMKPRTKQRMGSSGADEESGRNGRALYNTTSECWGAVLDESVEQVNILEVLQTLYDDCSDLLIVRPIVLGFCRLILTEQCQSVELMMKLLVTFFTTDTYPELVQILGAFFVELCENQLQDLLVMSLLPTLEYVSANTNLPVDMDSIVQFVVDSTSPKASDSDQYHIKLAHIFVETIQTNDKHKALVKIMFKYLNQLDIPLEGFNSTELEKLCTSLAKCDHVKPEQLETVRRKLSGVRRTVSVAASAGEASVDGDLTEAGAPESTVTPMEVIEEEKSDVVEEEEEKSPAAIEKSISQTSENKSETIAEKSDTLADETIVGTSDDEESEGQSVDASQATIPDSQETVVNNATVTPTTSVQPAAETAVTAEEEVSRGTVTLRNETAAPPTEDEDQETETDCSMSSVKENRGQSSAIANRRAVRSTAIPRLVVNGGSARDNSKLEERRLRQLRTNSKIPVKQNDNEGKGNKRALERSLSMTPDVKQKRAENDSNVRKRQLPKTTLAVPKTPPRRPPTKSTSTPVNSTIFRESRVVLSPLDMSEINKTTRRTTRSVTEYSKRSLRTRTSSK